jgi:hypothetical protein
LEDLQASFDTSVYRSAAHREREEKCQELTRQRDEAEKKRAATEKELEVCLKPLLSVVYCCWYVFALCRALLQVCVCRLACIAAGVCLLSGMYCCWYVFALWHV